MSESPGKVLQASKSVFKLVAVYSAITFVKPKFIGYKHQRLYQIAVMGQLDEP